MPPRQLRPVLEYLHRTAGGDPAGSPTDAELLERFVTGGDRGAFELLVWRHERMVLGVCRRLLPDPQDAEDAFQATFLVLVRGARTVRKSESLASWLYGVAYRCAGKARARTRRRARREQGGHDLAGVGAEDDRLAAAEQGEVWAVLDEEVERLPEKYRAPVVLCYLEGKTYDEAGRQLACHRATVSTRLTKARELLRNRLRARGVAVPAAAFATVLCTHAARAAVPAALINVTVKAAALRAAGGSAGTVPAAVLALTEGVMKTAVAKSLKVLAGVCLLAGVLAAGVWALAGEGRATPVRAAVDRSGENEPTEFAGQAAGVRQGNDRQKPDPLPLRSAVGATADDPLSPEFVARLGRLPAELVKAKKCDADAVDALYLAVLLRLPSEKERATLVAHLRCAKDREEGLRDVTWALVNSKEFLQLHGLDKDVVGSLKFLNTLATEWDKK
jgi:RNA polymerase sigma factor (sigma-70 family)